METADPGRAEEARALAQSLRLCPGSRCRVTVAPRGRASADRRPGRADRPPGRGACPRCVRVRADDRAGHPPGPGPGAASSRPKPDDPTSRVTDWQPALAEALKSTAADAPVLGVVLLTDGRQNAPAAKRPSGRRPPGGAGRAGLPDPDRLDGPAARRGDRGGQGARIRLPRRRRQHRGDAQARRLRRAARSP